MSLTKDIFRQSSGLAQFAKGYFQCLGQLLEGLDLKAIEAFVDQLEQAREAGNTVFIVGNGGSAATAAHMANDLATDVLRKARGGKPFRVWALTDSVPCLTAIANDECYENIFLNQLKIHYRPGDKLIAISASGNSPNVVAAARWVKEAGGAVMGMLGFDGGRLKEFCDVAIHAQTPAGDYGPVEDIHVIIDHLISNWLIYKSGAASR
ncbi:MAG: SIS domain-containing protein [Desulfarculus sp.]|jgi:D-sedoheptulose 7-phosphate isomerase|nr:MAG: SIS domain-containing protein [Desulfarculus sp.]